MFSDRFGRGKVFVVQDANVLRPEGQSGAGEAGESGRGGDEPTHGAKPFGETVGRH